MHLKHLIALVYLFSCSILIVAEPLTVSTVKIAESSSYQLQRSYGGQIKHRRESRMGFEMSGTIFKVHVQEGNHVKKGQPLITLDQASANAELQGAGATVKAAQATVKSRAAQLDLSRMTFKRHRDLSKNGHVSKQLLDELLQQRRINVANLQVARTNLAAIQAKLNKAQVALEKTVLLAPYDATVQSQLIDEGSIISPGITVIELVEYGEIEAVVGIPHAMINHIQKDTTFNFSVNKQTVTGKLKAILPQIDRATGTVTTIFSLQGDQLYAGSLTKMTLSVTVNERGFWIPLTSLAESQRGLWSVLVVLEDSRANSEEKTVETRLVEIIHRGVNEVFVRGTLNHGDRIIDSGTGRVVPGQAVRLTSRAQLPQSNSQTKGS